MKISSETKKRLLNTLHPLLRTDGAEDMASHVMQKIANDAGDDDGRWVTTEEGNHMFINGEGEPTKGNPYVLAAAKGEKVTKAKEKKTGAGSSKSFVKQTEELAKAVKKYGLSEEQAKGIVEEHGGDVNKAIRSMEATSRLIKNNNSSGDIEKQKEKLKSDYWKEVASLERSDEPGFIGGDDIFSVYAQEAKERFGMSEKEVSDLIFGKASENAQGSQAKGKKLEAREVSAKERKKLEDRLALAQKEHDAIKKRVAEKFGENYSGPLPPALEAAEENYARLKNKLNPVRREKAGDLAFGIRDGRSGHKSLEAMCPNTGDSVTFEGPEGEEEYIYLGKVSGKGGKFKKFAKVKDGHIVPGTEISPSKLEKELERASIDRPESDMTFHTQKYKNPNPPVPKKPTLDQYRKHPWGEDEQADKEMVNNAIAAGGPVATDATYNVVDQFAEFDPDDADERNWDQIEDVLNGLNDNSIKAIKRALDDADLNPFTLNAYRHHNWKMENQAADNKYHELCKKYGDEKLKRECEAVDRDNKVYAEEERLSRKAAETKAKPRPKTKLEIMQGSKKRYESVQKELKGMKPGIEKDVTEKLILPWIKGTDWMGGISDTKFSQIANKMPYSFDEIYDEFQKQIDKYTP